MGGLPPALRTDFGLRALVQPFALASSRVRLVPPGPDRADAEGTGLGLGIGLVALCTDGGLVRLALHGPDAPPLVPVGKRRAGTGDGRTGAAATARVVWVVLLDTVASSAGVDAEGFEAGTLLVDCGRGDLSIPRRCVCRSNPIRIGERRAVKTWKLWQRKGGIGIWARKNTEVWTLFTSSSLLSSSHDERANFPPAAPNLPAFVASFTVAVFRSAAPVRGPGLARNEAEVCGGLAIRASPASRT